MTCEVFGEANRAAVRRTMLIARERNLRVICVTGMTTTAQHHKVALELALAHALSGTRTLHLDLDGCEVSAGSRSVCVWVPGSGRQSFVPVRGEHDNLFLACGAADPQNVDLFNNPQFIRSAFDKELGDFGAIVCSTTPLEVADPGRIDGYSIAAACAGTMLVCDAAGDTTMALKAAAEQLRGVGAELIGCVLSQTRMRPVGEEIAASIRWIDYVAPRFYARLRTALERSSLLNTM